MVCDWSHPLLHWRKRENNVICLNCLFTYVWRLHHILCLNARFCQISFCWNYVFVGDTHFNYSPRLYYSASMNEKFQTHWALSPIKVFGAFWTKYCIILQLCKDVSYITRCKYLTFNVLEIVLVIENKCKIMSLLSELISIGNFLFIFTFDIRILVFTSHW